MAGIPHDHYEPKTGGEKWLHGRLPIVGLMYDTIMAPTPKNLNWMWIWGIVLTFCLALQIITGIVLAMHYTPHVDDAFASVEHIMRNVNGGYMLRYMHMNGASLFFIAVYAHIFRGLYYGSYKAPREVTWIIGMLIYLLMMGTAFMGYVLPWGQMSFWGATVITGLFGAIPFIGDALQTLLLGGPAVDNATLNRFFSLHYLFPFIIAGLVIVHIWAFHTTGNNNPTGVEVRRTSKEEADKDTLPFWPYFVIKDLLALAVILVVFFAIVGFMPNYLGHPDNYIEANPLSTPAHIVPEWYFLPFYAILRAFTAEVWVVQIASFVTGGIIDAKFFGVLAMFGAIAVMALVPWLDTSSVRSGRYRPMFKWWFALLVLDFFALMWLGAMPAEEPYASLSLIASAYWFGYFLVIMPLLGVIEKPMAQPETIEADSRRALRSENWRHQDAGQSSRVRTMTMIKKTFISAVVALGLTGSAAFAAGGAAHVEDFDFSFEGPFGSFDTNQLQRGLQVYTEICSACHGLQYVPLRTLSDDGGPQLPEDQMRAYSERFEVFDPELDDFRTATPVDHFPMSGLETAPDLSLMAKKRAGFHGPYGLGINQFLKGMGGPEYIASLLTGYEENPECAPEDFPGYYNKAFANGGIPESCKDEHGHVTIEGSWIAMAPPLYGDDVEYADGHDADLHHVAMDVSAFLMWTAEPKLMARKQAGFAGVVFLTLLSVLLYLTNKRLWAPIKNKED